jgi:lipopolysaccharide transport system permease protein
MYVSPVLYPLSLVPERWRWLYSLNPLVGILENFRAALLGKDFNWSALLISVVITLVVLVYASYDFRRMERGFADIV